MKKQKSACRRRRCFTHFVMLAKRLNLPVIIHNRLKEPRIFDILDEYFPFMKK